MFFCSTIFSTPAIRFITWLTCSRNQAHKSIQVGVLLRKIGRQTVPFEPNYCGFEIPDVFVVGYGLDYNDEYRHLPYVGVFDESK